MILVPVPEFPDYLISNTGEVWSTRGKKDYIKLNSKPSCTGYREITLYSNTNKKHFVVSTLVLSVFIGPCPNSMEACHNDGNRNNDHWKNLRWDTHKNNLADRNKHGTNILGERNGRAVLTFEIAQEIRKFHSWGCFTYKELSKRFDVGYGTIGRVLNNENWKGGL